MKSLLPNFVEFLKDNTIIPKEYPDHSEVKRSDQRSIIIITYNENTFYTNDKYRKIWTLNG